MPFEALKWSPSRPNALVVACSDGRLQEATDEFLAREFKITRYDRFYVPGGAGALASSSIDHDRAAKMCAECRYLVDLHQCKHVVLLFHGPAISGRIEAACADYKRKLPYAPVAELRKQQEIDAADLMGRRREFSGDAEVLIYRCEVDPAGRIEFVNLDTAPESPFTAALRRNSKA
jgi:hypothetical protein